MSANDVTVRKVDAKPTVPQIYKIARELCAIAGVTFPENRADASTLIGQLADQTAAVKTAAANADIPF